MTNISKTHERFSELLKNPRVLTNPEEFLGPNYEAVLNFWMILDELAKEQWKTIWSRYDNFCNNQRSEWYKVTDEAVEASRETIGVGFANSASNAAWDVYDPSFSCTTRELIGMNKLFEQNKPLTFFPMFLEAL